MIPLDRIGFGWRSHKAALSWLWVLYAQPKEFRGALWNLTPREALRAGSMLPLHLVPYLFLTRVAILYLSGNPNISALWVIVAQILGGIIGGVAGGIVAGVPGGIAVGIAVGIASAMGGGIGAGIATQIGAGIAAGVAITVAVGIEDGIPAAIATVTAACVGVGIAGSSGFLLLGEASVVLGLAASLVLAFFVGVKTGVAAGLGLGLASVIGNLLGRGVAFGIAYGAVVGISSEGGVRGIALGVTVVIATGRAYYYPFTSALVWPRVRSQWYRYHPIAWDTICNLPYPRLTSLLVALADREPRFAEREIDRIIGRGLFQANQALKARTILLARQTLSVRSLGQLPQFTAQLPRGAKGFLTETELVHEGVQEIARLQIRLDTIERAAFREPTAELLLKQVQNFGHRAAGLTEPLRTEFRNAAAEWEKLAAKQLEGLRAVKDREPIQQFFRAGDPVDRDREAFVPRHPVTSELEQQIMLATGCPGVILYGRRRVGKSTVLRNLSGFLPTNVRVAYLSAQSPNLFVSADSFAAAVSGAVRSGAVAGDLRSMFAVLGEENNRLEDEGKRLVLAVDEYEMIDQKIGERVFTPGLLDAVRESIQSHRAITWVFAGSHQITELPNAAWSSYLVSARLVRVPLFTEAETRLLLTAPAAHSTLWAAHPEKRPRFEVSFWGEGGIERIYAETGGWPHLVQLVAESCIDLLNDEGQGAVSPTLLERAFGKAVVRGEAVFYELLRRECTVAGEWEYLAGFRRDEALPGPEDEAVARALKRRELLMADGGSRRLRAPLMRRWIVEQFGV